MVGDLEIAYKPAGFAATLEAAALHPYRVGLRSPWHSNAKLTGPCDRRNDGISVDKVERMTI